MRQRYAGTRFEEQRQLHMPQKHKATKQDSALRVEMNAAAPSLSNVDQLQQLSPTTFTNCWDTKKSPEKSHKPLPHTRTCDAQAAIASLTGLLEIDRQAPAPVARGDCVGAGPAAQLDLNVGRLTPSRMSGSSSSGHTLTGVLLTYRLSVTY